MTGGAIAQHELRARLERLPRPLLWVMATRLKTLGLSQVPVLAGTWLAIGAGTWRPGAMVSALAASAAIQIGTNLWNDAADAERGVDGTDRLGPPRMTALGLLSAAAVRRAALASFALAAAFGLHLALIGGLPILALGLVSLALGYFYSMGPRPLSGGPWGEVLVLAFFGVVAVAGTMHLHGLAFGRAALLAGLAVGFPASAVLLVNNHRDRVSDARGGRRTLAIRIGENASRLLYALLLAAGVLAGLALRPCVSLLPAAILAAVLAWAMARAPIGTGLNRLIGATAALQLLILLGLVGAGAVCG